MAETELTVGQEENVLALLCFSEKHAAKIMQTVPVELFSTRPYRELAAAAVKHIVKYNKPPGVHLKDILEKKIKKSGDDGELLESIIDTMMGMRNSMQMEFMQNQVEEFVRGREISIRIAKAQELLNKGSVTEAEELIQAPMERRADKEGFWLQDTKEFLEFMSEDESDNFSSGVAELDKRGIVPARGQTFLFIAPMKKGKSWFLTQCGKINSVMGKRILHISLENSTKIVTKRYFQSFFAYASKKVDEIEIPRFIRDKKSGELIEVRFESLVPMVINEANRNDIIRKATRLARRPRMHFKSWPSGMLSISMLRAYLEHLKRDHNFEPDLVLLDYMDLMKLNDPKQPRESLGQLGVDLRGLADERNFALVTPTQGTRGSMNASLVSADMVSSDISKIATADTVVTYSQTAQERKHNFARLFVSNARDAADQYIVLITQSYATGQFCLDSMFMTNDVQDIVNPWTGTKQVKKKKDDDDG